MPNGPQRLILINSGRYDYADVELNGSIQIVGLNNTGKTTLINTLQFLYIDDRRYMGFGSYSQEQTREYYFPNQYSYVMFELLGTSGKCVFGWRGQSQIVGGEPERFLYEGAFDSEDFIAGSKVREPAEVNSRLGLKRYRSVKNAHEQREFLLSPIKGESRGTGIVALRDNDRYPHFRETLKNLLCLNTITQDEMRGQLMMLAGLSPDYPALDVRKLFGEDYERILRHKDRLLRLTKCRERIEAVIGESSRRDLLRGELACCWEKLQETRRSFEEQHAHNLGELNRTVISAASRLQSLSGDIQKHNAQKESYLYDKGAISGKIAEIEAQDKEFSGFMEQIERCSLKSLRNDIQSLEALLNSSESESLEKVRGKLRRCRDTVEQTRRALASCDRAMITFLRRDLREVELAMLSRLFNYDILELPVGQGGVSIHNEDHLFQALRLMSNRIRGEVYEDSYITLPLPSARRDVNELGDAAKLNERLSDEEAELERCETVLDAVQRRDALIEELNAKREQVEGTKDSSGNNITEGLEKRLFRYEEYQKMKEQEPTLRARLKRIQRDLESEEKLIQSLNAEKAAFTKEELAAKYSIESERDTFVSKLNRFNQCSAPNFVVAAKLPDASLPGDFADAVEYYNREQRNIIDLDQSISRELQLLERDLGPDFAGNDECHTVRLLNEELEALPDQEAVLRRDWIHQLTEMQATFDGVLKSLDDIKSAAGELNRTLSGIHVSNLASLHMDVMEQTDTVSSMRRLVQYEQPGLFDESKDLELAVSAFRRKFETSPLLRYSDLFTLRFTVTGEDGKPHHYVNFQQVESHGTTVTIKVLFNMLVLRRLLKEDSHKNVLSETPFFLDEIHSLDAVNRNAILATARELGFIAVTAAPESVSEVDALYFLQPQQGRITLRNRHRVRIMAQQRGA
jgi:hypothetical protein